MIDRLVLACRQIGETESSVADVLVQEVMAVEPVAFKRVIIDIDSNKANRKPKRLHCCT